MTIRPCLVLAGAAIVYLSHEAAAAPNAPKDVKFQPPFGKRLHNFKENPATTTGVDACIFLREGGFCDSWKARRKDMIAHHEKEHGSGGELRLCKTVEMVLASTETAQHIKEYKYKGYGAAEMCKQLFSTTGAGYGHIKSTFVRGTHEL